MARPSARSSVRLLGAFGAALVALAFPARAEAAITLYFDHSAGGGSVSGTYPGGTFSAAPGPYFWSTSPGAPASMITFCGELSQHISQGHTYDFQVSPVNTAPGTTGAALQSLFAGHFDSAWAAPTFTGSLESRAFQLAVWEIVYDGPAGLHLGDGNFTSTGGDLMSLATPGGLAQSWLTSLTTATATNLLAGPGQNWQLVWLTNSSAQDQLALIPAAAVSTPAPATLAVWVVGLGAALLFGGAARRVAVARA